MRARQKLPKISLPSRRLLPRDLHNPVARRLCRSPTPQLHNEGAAGSNRPAARASAHLPAAEQIIFRQSSILFEQRHLYSYTTTTRSSEVVLSAVVRWLLKAQRPDGGIPAYYSLLSGYSDSYPEVTGYIIPTLYDYARETRDASASRAAERAAGWLLSLQMPDGAFPAGLHGAAASPSVFNSGQILQGLVRACSETNRPEIRRSAIAAGNWLVQVLRPDGAWAGPGAYQDSTHTYYSMVAWSLAELSACTGDLQYADAAEKNLDWVLSHFQPSGWVGWHQSPRLTRIISTSSPTSCRVRSSAPLCSAATMP